jgi:hypothetical protein
MFMKLASPLSRRCPDHALGGVHLRFEVHQRSNTALIYATAPLWEMLLGSVLGLERSKLRRVVGVGLPLWVSSRSCTGARDEWGEPARGSLDPGLGCMLGLLHRVIFAPSPTLLTAGRCRLPYAFRGFGRLGVCLFWPCKHGLGRRRW